MELPASDSQISFSDSTSEEDSLQSTEEVTRVSISSPSYHRSSSLRERPPKRTRMATHEAITLFETFTPNLRLPIRVVYPELVQQNVTADTSDIIEL